MSADSIVTGPTRHFTQGGISLCVAHVATVHLQVLTCMLLRLLQNACSIRSPAHCNTGSLGLPQDMSETDGILNDQICMKAVLVTARGPHEAELLRLRCSCSVPRTAEPIASDECQLMPAPELLETT